MKKTILVFKKDEAGWDTYYYALSNPRAPICQKFVQRVLDGTAPLYVTFVIARHKFPGADRLVYERNIIAGTDGMKNYFTWKFAHWEPGRRILREAGLLLDKALGVETNSIKASEKRFACYVKITTGRPKKN